MFRCIYCNRVGTRLRTVGNLPTMESLFACVDEDDCEQAAVEHDLEVGLQPLTASRPWSKGEVLAEVAYRASAIGFCSGRWQG